MKLDTAALQNELIDTAATRLAENIRVEELVAKVLECHTQAITDQLAKRLLEASSEDKPPRRR